MQMAKIASGCCTCLPTNVVKLLVIKKALNILEFRKILPFPKKSHELEYHNIKNLHY